MTEVTLRQAQILSYIKDHIRKVGYPPSIREIMDGCRIKSTSMVGYHLGELERKGFIEREKGSSRAIRLVGYSVILINKGSPE